MLEKLEIFSIVRHLLLNLRIDKRIGRVTATIRLGQLTCVTDFQSEQSNWKVGIEPAISCTVDYTTDYTTPCLSLPLFGFRKIESLSGKVKGPIRDYVPTQDSVVLIYIKLPFINCYLYK